MKLLPKNLRAFTLIELLVVIGVLTVLLAIVLIAINPARQFAQANNTQRRSDVNAILNAIHQYGADNKGDFAAFGITGSPEIICGPVGEGNCPGTGLDICSLVVPEYIADMPVDPKTGENPVLGDNLCTDADVGAGEQYVTNYTVESVGASGRFRVSATGEAEGSSGAPTIQVTR